ncbi:MAG: glycerophosphodiester phosphodiesterase family protein [Hyphomonadaceae bacterium]
MRIAGAALAALFLFGCEQITAPEAEAPGAQSAAIAPPVLSEFFDCLRRENAAVVAAHRGGPTRGYPENAMATFARTLGRVPALLEIDVGQLRDGTLVLMHDDDVSRTTNGSGRLDEMNLEAFRALRLRNSRDGEGPATLQEALDWADGRTVLELDIKEGVPFEAVVEAVQRAVATERVIVIVYSTGAAIRLHRLEPDLMISVPIDEAGDLDRLRRVGVPLDRVLAWTGTQARDGALYETLRARGVEVIYGALGGADSFDERAARGAEDYGSLLREGVTLIATDEPEAAYRGLDQADGEGWAAERCLRE